MTEDPNQHLRFSLFLFGIFVWVLLVLRTKHAAARVASQWGNDTARSWDMGKLRLLIGTVGMLLIMQRVFPIPSPYRELIFFGCMFLGLIWGEWDVGTGFRLVANAQDSWHRRYADDDGGMLEPGETSKEEE